VLVTEINQVNVSDLAQATEQTLSRITTGDLTSLSPYVLKHLAPFVLIATCGLFVIFLGYLVAKYMSRIASRPICRRVDETLGIFVGKAIFYTIMLGVIGAVLSKLGAPLAGLTTMLAAAGFAIGLAFQGTLSNFAAGVLMLVFRPFKVGDMINAGGVTGKVNEIDLFTTTLDTPDNRRIIVPNSAIAGGTIENVTYHPHRRIEVAVGVEYAADQDRTRAALEAAVAMLSAKTIPGEGRGSAVILAGLGDSSVQWKVRMWVNAKDFWSMTEALTGEVKRQLDAAHISIPFPQLDVHIRDNNHSDVEQASQAKIRPLRRAA
jgi:small conductance mechanosensitive channel